MNQSIHSTYTKKKIMSDISKKNRNDMSYLFQQQDQ